MTFYVTRHGQVAPKENYGDVQFPAGDPPLTKIGSEQAEHLADFMKEIGFCGKIYSSPYARTMETAEIIADRTGSVIVPCAFMREILKTQEAADELCGMTMEELKVRYRHVVDEGLLPYPWWNKHFDTEEDVLARVSRGFTELNPQEDTMFVGHGASAGHLIQFLKIPEKQGRRFYNCSLSSLDTEHAEHCRYLETAHLPYHLVGQNAVMQLDADLKTLLTKQEAQSALSEMQMSADEFARQAGSLIERYSSSCKTLTESTKNALTTILNDTKNQLSDMEQTAQKKIITCAWISTAAVILCTALCALAVLWSR